MIFLTPSKIPCDELIALNQTENLVLFANRIKMCDDDISTTLNNVYTRGKSQTISCECKCF